MRPLWDVATGQPIGAELPESDPPTSIAFSPAGNQLAIARVLGTPAQLWAVAPVSLASGARYLCAEAGVTLSQTQWATYAPGVPYQDVCPGNPAMVS